MVLSYYLVLILHVCGIVSSVPCLIQPLRFGKNCSNVCHCLDQCDSTTEGKGCLTGHCSPGYTGFPACQEVCSTGTFGVGCTSNCNCQPSNICEPTNGNCINPNKCSLMNYGSGCQGVRSRLLRSPNIQSDCIKLLITWNSSGPDNLIGSLDIYRFVISFHSGANDTLSQYISVKRRGLHNFSFQPNDTFVKYSVSIRPDFYVSLISDKYPEHGISSPRSDPMNVRCPVLPGFGVSENGTDVVVYWDTYPNSHVVIVWIEFKLVSIGDCQSPPESNSLILKRDVIVSDLKLAQKLKPWSRYTITAFGTTRLGAVTTAVQRNITTSFSLPTSAPMNARLIRQSGNDNAIISWDPPPCEYRNGPFKSYKFRLNPDNKNIDKMLQNTTPPQLHLNGPLGDQTYTLSIAFENPSGLGPFASFSFTPGIRGMPTNISVRSFRPYSALVEWTAPDLSETSNLVLKGYRIEFGNPSISTRNQTGLIAPSRTQYDLRSLTESTKYELQVVSVFEGYIVSSNVIYFSTPSLSTPTSESKLSLLSRTNSTINVLLNLPDLSKPFACIFTVKLTQTLLPSPPVFAGLIHKLTTSQAINEKTFDSLPAATLYRITLSSDPSETTTIRPLLLDVWTTPDPFQSSSNLLVGKLNLVPETMDTITLQFPSIKNYNGGPLNGFYVVLGERTNVAKPKITSTRSSFSSWDPNLLKNMLIVYYSDKWPDQPITVGSNSTVIVPTNPNKLGLPTQHFGNPPLVKNKTYSIYAVVQSILPDSYADLILDDIIYHNIPGVVSGSYLKDDRSSWRNDLVSGVVGAFGVVGGLCLIAWFMRYGLTHDSIAFGNTYVIKQKPYPKKTKDISPQSNEFDRLLPKSYAWWSVPVDVREPRYLIIDPERGPSSSLVGTWSKKELADTFVREYASIPLGYKYTHQKSQLKSNRAKNRSESVVPYDHNRVTLERLPDSLETDYINATYIDGYMRRRAYIAAQSPFDTPTTCDFWLMVFQRNVSQIVMLTNLVEDGTLRCCQYWPDIQSRTGIHTDTNGDFNDNSRHYFGDLIVEAVDRVPYAHFTIRHFTLTDINTHVTRNVVQYQFHCWASMDQLRCSNAIKNWLDENLSISNPPLNDELSDLFSSNVSSATSPVFDVLNFIEFYYRIKTASQVDDGPLVVHCGAAMARTGIFLAFDILLQQATHERVVSTARVCSTLSKSRANTFRSTSQYVLLYDLLCEALLAGHNILDLDVSSTYRMLSQKNSKVGHSFLWEQWSVLHLYTPVADPDMDLRLALSASCAHKNRYAKDMDLLPPERFRVCLHARPLTPTECGYINAIFLDGAALRDDVILTQTPMSQTVDDFWLMIYEEKVSCIVDMEPFGYGIKEAVRYWPLRPGEPNTEPLFEGSSDEDRDRTEAFSDVEDNMSARGSWVHVANGQLQICQVGTLTAVQLDAHNRRHASNHSVYLRRLLVRYSDQEHGDKMKRRELLIFHFCGDWNTSHQVPESRVALVRLLEAVRFERGTGPLVVHCLDGATRSGLFSVCHLLCERMTRDHYVDLFHVIKAIKIRRRAVLSHQEQLRFVYRFLAQWIKQTLSRPLAAWIRSHNMGDGPLDNNWPQLIEHLPAHVRTGIYSNSKLTGDGSNANNSTAECPFNAGNEPPNSTLYYYFKEELFNQRTIHSSRCKSEPRLGNFTTDTGDTGSWSTSTLNIYA